MGQAKTAQADGYTIGALAKSAGVNVETIRYYQRIGLIKEPKKPRQGYRLYPADTVRQVQFIKRAQQLGFSLTEVAQLLALSKGRCRDVRQQAEKKREQITRQIQDLTALKQTLDNLIAACKSDKNEQLCPIVEALTQTASKADQA